MPADLPPTHAIGPQVALSGTRRWNWAAGTVAGLAALLLAFALPLFRDAVADGELGDAELADWLIYGGAALATIALVALGSRLRALVSTLAGVGTIVFCIGVVKVTKSWDLADTRAWTAYVEVIGAVGLGACAVLALRRE